MQSKLLEPQLNPGSVLPGEVPATTKLRGSTGINVLAAPHPLKTDVITQQIPVGGTITEILDIVQPDPVLMMDAKVFVGEVEIPRHMWARVRPKEGAHLTVRVHPPRGGGGGKNPLRIILSLALVAAVFFLAGPLGLALGLTGSLATAAGGAIISGVGGLLINALAPIEAPTLDSSSTESASQFIEGAQNVLKPFQPIPMVLGNVRFVPPLAAQTYPEVLGDTNRVRMILTGGYGRHTIKNIRIGETSIEDFEDYLIELRQGQEGDAPLTLYTNSVDQQSINTTILEEDGWVTRTTGPDADEISVSINFPKGHVRIGAKNDLQPNRVQMQIEWGPVGGPYLPLTEAQANFSFEGVSFVGNVIEFFQKRAVAIRTGIRWATGAPGQYDVRIKRLTADEAEGSKISNETVWGHLQSFTHSDPISPRKPISKIAIDMRASNQLNGTISDLSAEFHTVAEYYDPDAGRWKYDETNNPAALFLHVLKGPANVYPVTNDAVDLQALADWATFCYDKGYTYNNVHDSSGVSMKTVLSQIASAGRASPDISNGTWGVVVDRPRSYPVTAITPRNSSGFQLEKTFIRSPDAWRVRFQDETNDFKQEELRVPLAGKSLEDANVFESLELPGVTNPDQVYNLARFHSAVLENRPEQWTVNQDWEYLVARRGDRVTVQHDVMLVGKSAGRISELITSGGNITGFISDEEFNFVAGQSYGVVVRRNYGSESELISTHQVTGSGTTNTATLVTSIPVDGGFQVDDLYSFGLLGQETEDALVLHVQPDSDMKATLTLIPYREEIYTFSDEDPIPIYTPKVTETTRLPTPVVTAVTTDESVLEVMNSTTLVRAVFNVDPISDEQAYLEVRQRSAGTGEAWYPSEIVRNGKNFVTIGGVNSGEAFAFQLRWNATDRSIPGPWTTPRTVKIIGKSTNPQPLINLSLVVSGTNAVARWDQPDELDVYYGGRVEFRHSSVSSGPKWVNSTRIGDIAQARTGLAVLPAKGGTYFARVIDELGNYSTVVSIKPNILPETDGSAGTWTTVTSNPGWAGTLANMSATGSRITLDSGPDANIDDITDFNNIENMDNHSALVANGVYYEDSTNLGSVLPVKIVPYLSFEYVPVRSTNIDDLWELTDDWETWDTGDDDFNPVDAELQFRWFDPVGAAWSDWQRFDNVEIETQYFQVRVVCTSYNFDYNIEVITMAYAYKTL